MKKRLIKRYLVKVSLMSVTALSISGCVLVESDNKERDLMYNTLSSTAVRMLNGNEHCTYHNADQKRQCEEARQQQVEQINQSIKEHRQGKQ